MKKTKFGRLMGVVLAVGMLLSLAACGEKVMTREEYKTATNQFVADMQSLVGVAFDMDLTKPDDIAAYATAYKTATDKILAVKPPEDLTDAHAKLVSSLTEFQTGMDMLVELAKSTDADAITTGYAEFMTHLDAGSTDLNDALELFTEADFQVDEDLRTSLFF